MLSCSLSISLCCSLVFRLPEWMKFESFQVRRHMSFFHSQLHSIHSLIHTFIHSFIQAGNTAPPFCQQQFLPHNCCCCCCRSNTCTHTHKHRYNNGLHTHSSDTCHTSTTAKSKVPRARQTYKFKQISIHLGATDCRSASAVQSSLIPPPTNLPSKLLFLLAGKFWQHLCLKPHKGLYWFAAKTLIFFGLTNR